MQTALRQAIVVTKRYRDLQGLRLVAGGAGLLVMFGVLMFVPLSLAETRAQGIALMQWGAGLLVADFVAMLIAIRVASVWYDRQYGQVELTRHQRHLTALVGGVGAASFLAPFEIEIIAMNAHWTLPVNTMLVGLSIAITGYWLYLGREFVHYLVIACCGFALVILSLGGVPSNGFGTHVREGILFMAVASIAGGLIDHRILMQVLGRRSTVGADS